MKIAALQLLALAVVASVIAQDDSILKDAPVDASSNDVQSGDMNSAE